MLRTSLVAVLSCLLLPAVLLAKGNITGIIRDSASRETLIGVSVSLMQAGIEKPIAGTVSDINGSFFFEAQAGNYYLKIDYLGYQAKEIKDIQVQDGQVTQMTVPMEAKKNNELSEVVIRGSAARESINALYILQKKALTVSDGISAEAIGKTPDRNVGQVLKRVSGTTIEDNKFVIVRGLSDRYNTAMVDGAVMPSTEPNRKAFSFDIIPSAMIDNIIISKSATPDMPGDFAGGAINILTKEVPDQNFTTFSVGSGYAASSTGKKFLSGYRGPADFLGFAGSNRQLPAGFPTQAQINNHPERSIENLQKLHNDFSVKEHAALAPISLGIALGRLYYTKSSNRLGITAAVQYNHKEEIKKDIIRQYDNYDYSDNGYEYSSTLGAMLNIGYSFGKSQISLKSFYNRIFDDRFLYREGKNYGSSSLIKYYAFDLTQKSLLKTTLSATHPIGKNQSKLDWLLSYSYISNNQPDQRKVSYSRQLDRAGTGYSADITSLGKANNCLFSELGETIVNGGANYYLPFALFEHSAVKAGFAGQYRYRDLKNRYLGAVLDPMFNDGSSIRNLPVSQVFDDQTIARGPYFLEEQTLDADQYHAAAGTMAGYVMMDNQITEKLRLAWGARIEDYVIQIATSAKTVADKQWLDVLPSLNLTYALNDKANLRASYFRSVARPEFREMTNLTYYDYELSATMGGNPELERTGINNIDLRFEWFPQAEAIFSASLFYKRFQNAIENRVYGANSSYDITPFNSPLAENFGAEMEVRKNFDFFGNNSIWRNIYIYLNLAFIHSEAATEDLYVRGEKMENRPLSGQAPYVINTGLGYTSGDGKLSVNALYNRMGQRLAFIGQDRMGLIYEAPRNLLDFQVSYAVSKRSMFRFSVKDILNDPALFYFDQNGDKQFNGSAFSDGNIIDGQDWIWRSYKPGTHFSLGYSFSFLK